MASPGQIGSAGIGGVGGGAALSGFGALASGISNSNMYNYQAGVAKLNQQIDNQNAEFSRQTGEQQALQAGFKQSAQMGQIKAAQGASGFDVNSGSAVQVRTSQSKLNTLDTDVIRSNAAKTAYNYQLQGVAAGAQASADKIAGTDSLIAGGIGLGSSILGGAASVSSMWLQGARVGLWNSGGGGTNSSSTFGGEVGGSGSSY